MVSEGPLNSCSLHLISNGAAVGEALWRAIGLSIALSLNILGTRNLDTCLALRIFVANSGTENDFVGTRLRERFCSRKSVMIFPRAQALTTRQQLA